jgi:putative redox protein
MVSLSSTYLGELRCSATHGPSGSTLLTDAPVDNQGKGEQFSPTDLVATALGTCMLTTMAIVGNRLGVDIKGSSVHVEKHMAQLPVRRIAKIVVHFKMQGVIDPNLRTRLESAAHACPVHHSLHPEIEYDMQFQWE